MVDDFQKEKIRHMKVDERFDLMDGRVVIFRFEEDYWLMDSKDKRLLGDRPVAGWIMPNADEVIKFVNREPTTGVRAITVNPDMTVNI